MRKLGLLATLSAAVAGVAVLIPAGVSATSFTYQISLTESSSFMVYSGQSPSFRGSLTPPSDDPSIAWNSVFVAVDSVNYLASVSGIGPTYSFYLGGLDPTSPPVGVHSVVAKYLSPNHGWLISAPLTLRVDKSTPTLSCSIDNFANTYAPGAHLTIIVSFSNTNVAVDIQNGTFSFIFAGTRTFTFANLKANSAGDVITSTPSVTGIYQAKCRFSGTSSFNSVEERLSTPTIIVSGNHRPGGIALYTNPTPVTHGPMITWEVIVYAGSGLPTPTGRIALRIGGAYTYPIALAAAGRVTFRTVAPYVRPSDTIRVFYYGDRVYAFASATFPLTTHPIPVTAAATPTPAVTPTHGPAAKPSPTPGPPTSSPSPSDQFNAVTVLASSNGPSSPGGSSALYWVAAAASLTLIGLGSGQAWRRRRRRRASA